TVFGAGGGTSSYEEVENADLILLWGSNARAAHPIFFHHVLKGMHAGAKLIVVDPRRTESAEWADLWLGIDVGTDIALSNTIAREIIANDLQHHTFIDHATTGYEEYRASVMDWTLERGETVTGVPGDVIREVAHAYATAGRAQICWTLGITEHHNAVDNVLCLINLGLLTGHVGTYGSGLNPLRGQNNVQGGGDMGAIPNKLPGFQDIEKDAGARARFGAAWGVPIIPRYGWTLTQQFEAMERGDITALYVIGENPATSEADNQHAKHLLENLDCLIVQDLFMTQTAEMADVVLPASNAAFESEGTVTNSERRVQRVRAALSPPGEARDDIRIIADLADRLGAGWGELTPFDAWEELRSLSPMHAGMSWERIETLRGIQWPCPDESHPGTQFLHARLWEFGDPEKQGAKAPFSVVVDDPPVDLLDAEFPLRLTTGRRLESFNTGAQTRGYTSPLRRPETIDVSPEDAERLSLSEGERVRISSRRGTVEAPVHVDPALRPGLVFMTFHFPEQVETNNLTIEATDPKSGTAEFKATAVRIDRLQEPAPVPAGDPE
ncbi:MAG: molybdopterin-dependent oxidoreductase, partial [Actinomycetota bacterium]|nr:molybdopterin-dependent oxidoreductase [Actinomycetota bacterium]